MHRVGTDLWGAADRYEPYVGRWSRLIAQDFVGWLGIVPGARWLDVGCGTGALSSAIIRTAAPAEVRGVDPAEGFVATADSLLGGTHFAASVGDAAELPFHDDSFDWSSRASFSPSFRTSGAPSRKRAASRGRAAPWARTSGTTPPGCR
jgi:ubiquinone/menaquinone biosynthesis C-methylase UbiE